MLPTNLRVTGATEDLLLEVMATELGAELGTTELGATELRLEFGTELGTELEGTLEDRVEDTGPPAHTEPFMVGRSAVAPFLFP